MDAYPGMPNVFLIRHPAVPILSVQAVFLSVHNTASYVLFYWLRMLNSLHDMMNVSSRYAHKGNCGIRAKFSVLSANFIVSWANWPVYSRWGYGIVSAGPLHAIRQWRPEDAALLRIGIYASLVATCCRREFLNGEICLASGDHVMDLKVNSDQIDNMKDMLWPN